MLDKLREALPIEEFDYNLLMDSLKEYKKPRDKTTQLLRDDSLLRVKKGIYVFGPKLRREPYSLLILANLIYGPSYVSKESALAYYGLISNHQEAVTSITNERKKSFKTPVGNFTYQYLHPKKYSVGILSTKIDEHRYCLIASPEKALADLLAGEKNINSSTEMIEHLAHHLRIDLAEFNRLDFSRMREIADAYLSPNVNLLAKAMGG